MQALVEGQQVAQGVQLDELEPEFHRLLGLLVPEYLYQVGLEGLFDAEGQIGLVVDGEPVAVVVDQDEQELDECPQKSLFLKCLIEGSGISEVVGQEGVHVH